jgi:glycosyltransferase involved in cell wall biosynthesis
MTVATTLLERPLERIAIGWEVGLPSGWGMYGLNLALDLVRRGIDPALLFVAESLRGHPPPVLAAAIARGHRPYGSALDFPLLQALGDRLDLPDQLRGLTGQPTVGVAFCESAVIPKANLAALADFAGFIAGSSWNAALLESHGLTRVRFCPQGVDLDLFKPAPSRPLFPGRFAVFSGGKLEYRKGQDLVIAAFKKFRARHADALLVTAWHNPWPAAAAEMAKSPHVTGAPPVRDGRLDVDAWLGANGIDARDYVDLGAVGHAVLPEVLHGVDVALLPSRCEGGTNLVAMECMACGIPTILSRNTGHLDLIGADNGPGNCYVLDFQIPLGEVTGRADLNGWGESSIDEIVAKLDAVYADRTEAKRRGANGATFMQGWGWPAQIDRLLDAVTAFS